MKESILVRDERILKALAATSDPDARQVLKEELSVSQVFDASLPEPAPEEPDPDPGTGE